MATQPCTCDNFDRGKPLRPGQCALCWAHWQNEATHRTNGGTGCFDRRLGTIVEPCPAGAVQEPGLLQKAVNFGKAVVRHVAAGLPEAPPELKRKRLELCAGCVGEGGYWDAAKRKCLHPECGCNVDAKAGWLEQQCPLGKW